MIKGAPMKRFLVLIFLFVATSIYTNPFSHLKSIKYKKVKISYAPHLTTIINKKLISIKKSVLITRINRHKKTKYLVQFGWDKFLGPLFTISMKKKGKQVQVGQISTMHLIIPGNGYLYTKGHINNMFYMKRKYQIKNLKLLEIIQPFFYVGKTTKTLKPISIYSNKDLTHKVARLPKGYQITILLNQGSYYLLKTGFGLVGWVKLSGMQKKKRVFKEIYFKAPSP